MHVEWFKLVLWNGLVDSFMWFGLVWFDATVNNYDGGVGWGGVMIKRHPGLVWVKCGSQTFGRLNPESKSPQIHTAWL
jgi:hypothetical protein